MAVAVSDIIIPRSNEGFCRRCSSAPPSSQLQSDRAAGDARPVGLRSRPLMRSRHDLEHGHGVEGMAGSILRPWLQDHDASGQEQVLPRQQLAQLARASPARRRCGNWTRCPCGPGTAMKNSGSRCSSIDPDQPQEDDLSPIDAATDERRPPCSSTDEVDHARVEVVRLEPHPSRVPSHGHVARWDHVGGLATGEAPRHCRRRAKRRRVAAPSDHPVVPRPRLADREPP